jgi:hypothetical protein
MAAPIVSSQTRGRVLATQSLRHRSVFWHSHSCASQDLTPDGLGVTSGATNTCRIAGTQGGADPNRNGLAAGQAGPTQPDARRNTAEMGASQFSAALAGCPATSSCPERSTDGARGEAARRPRRASTRLPSWTTRRAIPLQRRRGSTLPSPTTEHSQRTYLQRRACIRRMLFDSILRTVQAARGQAGPALPA